VGVDFDMPWLTGKFPWIETIMSLAQPTETTRPLSNQ